MDPGVHALPATAGHQAFHAGGERAEQPVPTGDGYAGDQAEQLRDGEAVAVGTDPGEAVQDRHQGAGAGAVPAAGLGLFSIRRQTS